MPSYKLIYFNIRARAEVSRLLFAQAGVEYEDCRLTSEEFGAIKSDPTKVPLGQLPVLEIEGHRPLPQSAAIERHLARTFGMNGKTEKETVLIDVTCETVKDLTPLLIKIHFETKDADAKATLVKQFIEKDSVAVFNGLSQGLKKNNEGKGYFIGDSMTLADLYVFNLFHGLIQRTPVLATKYPVLKEFTDRMAAEPKLAAWIAKRPETPF